MRSGSRAAATVMRSNPQAKRRELLAPPETTATIAASVMWQPPRRPPPAPLRLSEFTAATQVKHYPWETTMTFFPWGHWFVITRKSGTLLQLQASEGR